jgi:XTP/dITP diphosphohydrolase
VKLCFATNNKHKIEEAASAAGSAIQIISLSDLSITEELAETRDTLEGNALQKAEYVFDKTGVPCFADDSGLEVEALAGAPGVFSARYAGPGKRDGDNIRLLLENLKGNTNRAARFRTIIALVGLGNPELFEGSVEGTILHEQRGAGGFGYDPVFKPNGTNLTFAEMSLEEKNAISHRAKAIQKLITFLKQLPNG